MFQRCVETTLEYPNLTNLSYKISTTLHRSSGDESSKPTNKHPSPTFHKQGHQPKQSTSIREITQNCLQQLYYIIPFPLIQGEFLSKEVSTKTSLSSLDACFLVASLISPKRKGFHLLGLAYKMLLESSKIYHPKWVLFIGDFPPMGSRSFKKKKRLQRIQSFYTGWWLNQPHLKKIWIVKLEIFPQFSGWKNENIWQPPPTSWPHPPSIIVHPSTGPISWPAPMPGRSLVPQQPHHPQNLASKRPVWHGDDGMMGWKVIP